MATAEGFNEILIAVVFSLNSSTYTHGRSPYQAVFGRLPRPVGDVISDHRALAISNEDTDPALRPELFRAEAISALMQLSASHAVKRALLRKTRNQNDVSRLQPGQAVAHWRVQGRARQHKKGSWCLGRFLAFDPDKRSCWIQVGRNSVRVGVNQLRAATGWEAWTPSKEDLQLLKDAKENVARGLWQDDSGPPPTEDQVMHIDEQLFDFHPRKAARLDDQQQLEQPMPATPALEPSQAIHHGYLASTGNPCSFAGRPNSSIPPGDPPTSTTTLYTAATHGAIYTQPPSITTFSRPQTNQHQH